MKKFFWILPVAFLSGCLSSASVPSVSYWLMEFRDTQKVSKSPKYGVARLSQVIVSQPYSGERFVVLRKGGTVAFDSANVFAAPPTALLKDVGLSALKSSGLFTDVISATSGASSDVFVELVVNRLALDCRAENTRQAIAETRVVVLSGKSILATAVGEGVADASDGDYGVAFSKAASAAVSSALSRFR